MSLNCKKTRQQKKKLVNTQIKHLNNTFALKLFSDMAAENPHVSGVNYIQTGPEVMVSNNVSKFIGAIYISIYHDCSLLF